MTPLTVAAYHHFAYAERIFPGVYFQGRDLSGKTPEQVFSIVLMQNNYYDGVNLQIDIGGNVKKYAPTEFGV